MVSDAEFLKNWLQMIVLWLYKSKAWILLGNLGIGSSRVLVFWETFWHNLGEIELRADLFCNEEHELETDRICLCLNIQKVQLNPPSRSAT